MNEKDETHTSIGERLNYAKSPERGKEKIGQLACKTTYEMKANGKSDDE